MDTVPGLLSRDRRESTPAVSFPATDREMSYHDFITTAYKSGNVLRYLGVGSGATVAIEPELRPEPLLAFFGAAQLGAVATFETDRKHRRVLLTNVEHEATVTIEPGTRLAVYGGPPTKPATTHWEKEVWSENPGFPPSTVTPETPVLLAGETTYTHADLMEMAQQTVSVLSLSAGERLGIHPALSKPETIGRGLIGALSVGATAVFTDEPIADAYLVDETNGTVDIETDRVYTITE